MSNDTIVALLADYEEAVDGGGFMRASEILDELLAEYHSIRGEEESVVRQAIVARDQLDLTSENRESLDAFAQTYLGVQFGRSGFTGTAGTYETNPAVVDTATVRKRADDLGGREQRFVNREKTVQEVLDTVETPGALAVVSLTAFTEPVPFETTQTINSTIQNVGDTDIQEVTITGSSPLLSSSVTKSVGTIAGGEEVDFSFDIEATATGDTSVTVRATATNAGSTSRDRGFEVRAKRGFATDAADRIRSVRNRIKENDAVSGGRQRSLVEKLNEAIDSVERAIAAAADGDEKQANNALNTAIEQLRAFLNEFTAGEDGESGKDAESPGSDLSEEFRGSVILSIESIINTLDRAKTAAIAD